MSDITMSNSSATQLQSPSKQPKSILKNKLHSIDTGHDTQSDTTQLSQQQTSSSSHTKPIQWDEANLQINEQIKALNPKQKITEPKTPYTGPHHNQRITSIDSMSDMSLDSSDVNNNTNDETISNNNNTISYTTTGDNSSDDDNDNVAYNAYTVSASDNTSAQQDPVKHAQFESKRHSFYKGEFDKIKQLKQVGALDDDDDSSSDDGRRAYESVSKRVKS